MQNKVKGLLFIVVAGLFFATMSMFVKLSGDLPFIQKSFFRNIVAVFFSLALLLRNRNSFKIPKGSFKYLFFRAFFGTVGICCNFYAIDHLVLSDANMLNKMSPFFAIIFSYFLLKEKPSKLEWVAVAVAFIGSLFVIKPSLSNIDFIPALIGLAGGVGAGFAYPMVRKLGSLGVNKSLIVFFFSAFSCLVTLPFMIIFYQRMSGMQLVYLLLSGLMATGGQFCITNAYTYAPAKELSVYDYSQILFSAVIGFLVFNQTPDIFSILGYLIIILMAVIMFLNNSKKPKLPPIKE